MPKPTEYAHREVHPVPLLTTQTIKTELMARSWPVPGFPDETVSSDMTEPENLAQLSMLWARILREQRTPRHFEFDDVSTGGTVMSNTDHFFWC